MYACMYVCVCISVNMAAPWGSLTLLSFQSLCLHLRSHLTKWGHIPERLFVILSQCKAYAGRFQKETAGKRTGPITKWPAREASVHPVRNRLCYHFSLCQTNESCSQSVSRRGMLLRRFNKSCLRVTAPELSTH